MNFSELHSFLHLIARLIPLVLLSIYIFLLANNNPLLVALFCFLLVCFVFHVRFMFQWDRNTIGRLVRSSIPQEQGCELNLDSDQMEPPPEEQQSQQGNQRNLNTYRSMRDHIHPPRVSAPSCIVPPTKDMIVRPYNLPLLPTFHGMDIENPYSHI